MPFRRDPTLELRTLQRRTNSLHERRLIDASTGGNRAALPRACRAPKLLPYDTARAMQLQAVGTEQRLVFEDRGQQGVQ